MRGRRIDLAVFVLVIVFGSSVLLVSCIDEDEYIAKGSPTALAIATSRVYNRILNVMKIFNQEIRSSLLYCIKDVETDVNGAFKFTNDLDFVSDCIQEMKDVSMRVCTAAEMKFYFASFSDTKSANSANLRPNLNCNTTLWGAGCEAGWSSALPQDEQPDLTNLKDIPERTRDSRPCCAGFFCPRGLTCMIPCPLGSYCPRATLDRETGICSPYAYQIPSGKTNHSCGGADTWEGVATSEEIFCSAGSYCPTTTKKVPCTKGNYCRQGSTTQTACFFLSTCNTNSEQQNLHGYGFMLIGASSVIMIVFYNCSDKMISIRYARLAKSRERAARSVRGTTLARERWKFAKNQAVSMQKKSRALSRNSSAQQGEHAKRLNQETTSNASLPPTVPSNTLRPPPGGSRAKKEGDLTKMVQSLDKDPDNHKGFDVEIGNKNIKKQKPKPKELHTRSQIFKYAYNEIEKEKAKEQKRQNLTFSGVIAMATNKDTKKRPSIEVAFKDLTITLERKHKHLMRSVTGKLLPGRISAVMGPSGAGKTTFLSAVAGKIRGCTISGSILVNGKHDSIHCYKKIIGFVPQDDIVHGNLTVEENLRFSARCRLSADIEKADKVLIIERVIESLGLQGVRDSLVGTVEKRGISGGQRKRVNVGLEMVMEPSLLILDEPTSGLDSSSSNLLLRALRREALEGVNICMVVHQPSYTLYKMFDDLILLAKGGLTVYHGPIKKVEEYFGSFGITIPDRVPPSDHLIDILEGIVKPSAGWTVEQLPVRWMLHNGYPVPPDMLQYCDPVANSSKGVNAGAHGAPEASVPGGAWQEKDEHSKNISLITQDLSNRNTPSLLRQQRYFLGRIAKQRLREAQVAAADYLILLIAGVCLGTLSKTKGDTFGYFGYMYSVIAISLLCMISALRSFSLDKLQHRRETESGMSSLAYFLSKDMIDQIHNFLKPLVFLSMFYSFYHPRSSFWDNYVVLESLVYCVTGIAYIFAILLKPGAAQLSCVLLPVVLTLVASQGKNDTFAKYVGPYLYPQWALEAFIVQNAQRYSGVWLITRCGALYDFGYDVHDFFSCIVLLQVSGFMCRFLAFLCLIKFGRR